LRTEMRLIEEARASGFIAGAIARAGLVGVDVAPPRQAPPSTARKIIWISVNGGLSACVKS